MDSSKLHPSQCRKIAAAIAPATAYLLKVKERMVATHFPKDDVLFVEVSAALESLRALGLQLKERSYEGFTGPKASELRHAGDRRK